MQEPELERKRVIIIGGGFGGIHAALGLRRVPVDITLIDQKNHHTFQPLLYQVALAVLSPADMAQPIRTILRGQQNADVLLDEVTGFDLDSRLVLLRSGSKMEYDFLVVASGSTHSYFGKDEWAKMAPGLKTVEDATEIRRRVLLAFELAEREMLQTGKHGALHFVVIGGGATGVELAGAISDTARLYMKKDFHHIDPASASVTILEGSPKLLGAYPDDLQISARKQLEALGVQIRTGLHVTDIQPGYVMAGEERIDSVCTLWAAGVQASPLGALLGVECDKKGCVPVNEYLNPKGHPEIFVLGDLARFEQDGKQVPGVAQPAMQMGDYAAQRIGKLRQQAPGGYGSVNGPGFRYFDKGDMATIGRHRAIARIGWPFKAHWSGLPAFSMWCVVHIFFLMGFRNRASVAWHWLSTYASLNDGARLITGSTELPGAQARDEVGGE